MSLPRQIASGSVQVNFSLDRLSLDSISQAAGVALAENLQIAVLPGDQFFHRVVLPEHLEYPSGGTSPPTPIDSIGWNSIPAMVNATSSQPAIDQQGQALNFARIRLIVVQIGKRRPLKRGSRQISLITSGIQPANGSILTIGSVPYTLVDSLTPTEGEIIKGANATATLLNVARAINHTGTPGTDYSVAAAHPEFSSSATVIDQAITLSARSPGPEANSLPLTTISETYTFGEIVSGTLQASPEEPEPMGGTVSVELAGVLSGIAAASAATFSVDQPSVFAFAGDYEPNPAASINAKFIPDGSIEVEEMNAFVTILMIGNSA